MSQLLDPITQRDFSAGRIAKSAVATALVPTNSVANSINVDYSEIIGSGIVRKGKQDILQITTNMVDGQASRVTTGGSDPTIYSTHLEAQTFTPTSGQTNIKALILKLTLQGTNLGNVTVSLQTTSGGHPTGTVVNGNSWIFSAGYLKSTSTTPISFPINPGTTLTASTVYGIVVSYILGDGSTSYVTWVYNSGTAYSGGAAQHSTDGGTTWSNDTGSLYFAEQIFDTTTTYNFAPLGNYSFLNNNLKKNVLGFEINDEGLTYGALYYYDVTTSTWKISNLFNQGFFPFSGTAKVRFANLDGSVFEVNGVNPMHDSADFGETWEVSLNDIFPYDIATAQSYDSSINYALNALVFSGSFFYVSLIDNNMGHTPASSPSDWGVLSPLIPSLIIVSSNRVLASGITFGPLNNGGFPSRVYFSSLVTPGNSPFITWNTDPTVGDWFDIDPDSGGIVTAFANVSTMTLAFKTNGMYRINTIARSVDAENVFNVGCVSQEALTNCLGLVYFYSGDGIYSTDSTFPQNISRIGVQDYIDAISDPQQVYSWADEFNVYFSIGAVTLTFGPEDQRTYKNVVLKFSPRDQNWQVMSYNQYLAQTSQFGIPPASLLATEYSGAIATVNSNTISDDGAAISYDLETQEQEFGDRSHTKNISDKMVVYNRNGNEGAMSIKENDGSFLSMDMTLENRVNVGTDVNFEGQFFTFKWRGEALGSRPIFEGYHLPKVTDLGITQNDNTN